MNTRLNNTGFNGTAAATIWLPAVAPVLGRPMWWASTEGKCVVTIELHEITEPVEIACPHCAAPLLRVFADRIEVAGGGYYLNDGDTVDGFYGELTPEQKEPSGYCCELLLGSASCCGLGYVVIEDVCVNGPWLDEFASSYIWHKSGPVTFLLATRGAERWIVERQETPLGPMLTHQFGPFAWADTSWIGPHGVTSCQSSYENAASPWRFADAFLLERWDDLQALTRSLPVPASAAEYIAAHPNPPKPEPAPGIRYDDDEWLATHCGRCQEEVPKVVDPDGGIHVLPLCGTCTASLHAWLETHCDNCRKELPRVSLEPGKLQFCERCIQETLGCRLCGRVMPVGTPPYEPWCPVCYEGEELGLSPEEAIARSQALPDYRKADGWPYPEETERKEPFWAEIAVDQDATDMFHYLGLSALYDHPKTDNERERVDTALETCRQKDPLGPNFPRFQRELREAESGLPTITDDDVPF